LTATENANLKIFEKTSTKKIEYLTTLLSSSNQKISRLESKITELEDTIDETDLEFQGLTEEV
jgi:hypothetical protein